MASYDAGQFILVNFEELSLNWLRMSFGAREWQTLHNTAFNGPYGLIYSTLITYVPEYEV